jgi:hypothetical protein
MRSSSLLPLRLAALATCAAALAALAVPAAPVHAQTLRGSRHSVNHTYHYAVAHDLDFTRTSRDVKRELRDGTLVRLGASPHFVTRDVSFPYVTPVTRTFVRRLAAEYHHACGELLVITSAVRPETVQPANASERSVHPAGIAVDLRRPANTKCRTWLRHTLLTLEHRGVLDATEEHFPAHFHVALFPVKYEHYLASR